jgi:hypothetical protein
MNFKDLYDLESYLFNVVRRRFIKKGHLTAFDFFCIIIWKANRAKSKIAKKLISHGYKTLDAAVKELTIGVAKRSKTKDKLRYLFENWKFRLPMATAILTVLYPKDFTIYDIRVCEIIGNFHNLDSLTKFENIWLKYQEFKQEVEKIAPNNLCLRDKDRFLWGKSFYEQLVRDIGNNFNV